MCACVCLLSLHVTSQIGNQSTQKMTYAEAMAAIDAFGMRGEECIITIISNEDGEQSCHYMYMAKGSSRPDTVCVCVCVCDTCTSTILLFVQVTRNCPLVRETTSMSSEMVLLKSLYHEFGHFCRRTNFTLSLAE